MNVSLRAGGTEDFEFARTIYFEEMRWIIEQLFGWEDLREQHNFSTQFKIEEVQIILVDGLDVGWLQTRVEDSSIKLLQLYVMRSMQRQGIGTAVLKMLLAPGEPVTLGVVKINPAFHLYQRNGFRVTHEDKYKFYMRFEPPSLLPQHGG